MRKGMLIVIAVAGMAVAAVKMSKPVPTAQVECCGDPICWPCRLLGLQ
jgi:hypothetical protein